MEPTFLIISAVSLINIIFIRSHASLSRAGKHKWSKKLAKPTEEIPPSHRKSGFYYRYVEGIPNYEAGQRMMAKLGNHFKFKLPFISTRYQVVADPVTRLMNSVMTMNKIMTPVATFLEIAPFLRHFPALTFLKDLKETSDLIYDILREVTVEKRLAGNYKEHVEDFVDGLLEHVDKSAGCEDGLNEENVLVLLLDMLAAGVDRTSATLEHALLLIALHPEVQEKVQAEIDGVIGSGRAPSYDDRRRMPYTKATLHETYCIGSTGPATCRAKLEDNDCSYAIIILYGMHRNESLYDKPNEFKPQCFLDKEDPMKIVNTENLIPFGYGRRSCPGETATRVAVFIYFVGMLQKYSIKLSSHHPSPSMKNSHRFSRSPLPYYITIQRRH